MKITNKTIRQSCVVCEKKFNTGKWLIRKGGLKGSWMTRVMCSVKCKKRFGLMIALNDILEEFDKLKRIIK